MVNFSERAKTDSDTRMDERTYEWKYPNAHTLKRWFQYLQD